jgi:hypothetical protein
MKRKPRKPRVNNNCYPRLEVEKNGRIWMQAVPNGKWKKVPLKRANYLLGRFQRVVKYAEYQAA